MRQHPPSFGIVSRDCYDANLLAALRKAQARADAAEARVRELEGVLVEIRDVDWIENCLDPQRPARLAKAALPKATPLTHSDGELT